MDTPIADFLADFEKSGVSRFFMPGHKGKYPFEMLKSAACFDLTEIVGADSLFEADGIISRSEANAAVLFNAAVTCFSAGGSTLSIQTMLALAVERFYENGGQGSPKIIASRNAHAAFINGCALLDITPVWVCPSYNDQAGISGEIDKKTIEEAIAACPEAAAVYITSPDYLGCMSDVEAIAALCKSHNKLLLVDNAHGAHLRLLKRDLHPMTLGASLCCDSAHKTLPALTGAAYLHASKESGFSANQIKSAMHLFGSTSPSYLIMLSLDLCNKYISEKGKADFLKLEKTAEVIKGVMAEKGMKPICKNSDPTKITLDGYAVGMTGEELADYFRELKIECEYSASRHVVMMLSPQNTPKEINSLIAAIEGLTPKAPILSGDFKLLLPKAVLSPRSAMLQKHRVVKTEAAIGEICAETVSKCPPGVPIAIPGEKIDEATVNFLKKCSINEIAVL